MVKRELDPVELLRGASLRPDEVSRLLDRAQSMPLSAFGLPEMSVLSGADGCDEVVLHRIRWLGAAYVALLSGVEVRNEPDSIIGMGELFDATYGRIRSDMQLVVQDFALGGLGLAVAIMAEVYASELRE